MTTRTAELSDTQARMLAYLQDFIGRHGYAPSVDEIMADLGVSSKSEVQRHLRRLEVAGYIRRQERIARGLTLRGATTADDLRAVIEDHADNLDLLAAEVYHLDADTLHQALTARAEGLRAALATAGVEA